MSGLFTSKNDKKVIHKTDAEIELIRKSALLVSQTLGYVASLLKPGVTGASIDQAAETFIRDHHGRPAFKGYNGFPFTLCMSPNDTVVHGFPGKREFQENDVVSIDCGVELDGFYGDSAFTFAFGNVDEPVMELLRVTYTSLHKGIEQAVAGKRLEDISFAIQHYCEREHGYGVVRELVGHGIGRSLHEEPEVPNYGRRGKGMLLQEGLVLAIEPMINLGRKEVHQANDGWTILTRDHKPSAHYEHTVAVRKNKADVLSDHTYVFEAIKNNPSLKEISLKN